jgi:POT family proton-dependent oligopeptide transporter
VTSSADLKHPPGLPLLFFTEMWERFSYYGMRALLVLFLIDTTTGGFGWTQEKASHLYGWYTGLVYLTPIIGGWLADRYLGTARALLIGGAVIALGHFTLAGETKLTFFLGLGLIIIGTGFFKANVSTLVGQLYGESDPRRDAGFTIFYMGINMGGFLGPLVCGWLAVKYGWSYGFAAAGVGMVLGLITFVLLRKKYLGEVGMTPMGLTKNAAGAAVADVPLTRQEKGKVLAIVIVVLFVAYFWLAFEQTGSSLNVFGQQKVNRAVGGALGSVLPNGEIPAAWFQSVNSFFIIALAPLVAMIWNRLGTRQPSTPMKMVIGLLLLGLGYVLVLPGSLVADQGGLANPWLLVGLYCLHSIGELCLSPVGLSFVTKVAPVKIASVMMGVWFLSNFLGNFIGGFVAGTVEKFQRGEMPFSVLGGQSDFFLMFAIASFGACALLLVLVPWLKRLIGDRA